MTTWTAPAPASSTTAARPAIASLFKRGLASFLDACIVLLIAAVPLGLIWLASGEPFNFESGIFSTPTKDATTGELVAKVCEALAVLLSWMLYVGLLTSRTGAWNGQTVGKRISEIRITAPDGSALSPRAARRRVMWQAVLLGGVSTAGALADLITGSPPTGTLIATGVGSVLTVVAIAPVLRGQQRQTLYDRLAGTVVITEPKVLPQLTFVPPAEVNAYHPVAEPVIAQAPPTAVEGGGSPAPRSIAPRPVGWKTWTVVLATLLCSALGAISIPFVNDFTESLERGEKIRAMPENKAAFAKLRTLEQLGETCLKAGRSPERCDEAGELGATGMAFADGFDLSADPVGAHAGKVGAVADGDDVIFYAFTSADRTWSTTAGGGWLDRVCIERDGDLCKDAGDW